MKDIIYFVKESYENWNITQESSNFMKDCIYDMIQTNEINVDEYNYKEIIKNIIDEIHKLNNSNKYKYLLKVLKLYPNTNFKDNINKMIDTEIKKYSGKK